MSSSQALAQVVAIGVGATAVMDLWLVALRRLGVPVARMAMIGRWVGHMAGGRFVHASIAQAAPLAHEAGLGWLVHYAVGIAFAGLLVALRGVGWLHEPSPGPALLTGLATVALPLCVMQPAMGAGLASMKTAAPLKNIARSVANHAVFGLGLYAAALVLAWLARAI